MIVLLVVALLAGAGTALSPCVLPLRPALLAATGTGGRRRPVGVVIGLTVTFGVTIVGLSEVVDGVGLGTSATRNVAIVVLIAAGFLLLVPRLADRVEAPLSRLARFGPRSRGDGLASGLIVTRATTTAPSGRSAACWARAARRPSPWTS
jgi:cytochrome c biogenesis protein CcdA